MTVRVFLCVIPVQAGIQWLLRGARLDPGSALRAVRDDNREKERVGRNDIRKQVRGVQDDGAGSTLRVVHEDARKYARHCPFAVIPAKAGIQWLLRGACLDPGSALRAVRDDGAGSALRAVRDDGTGSALCAVRDDGAGSALCAVRDDGAGSALCAVRDDGAGSALRAVRDDGAGSALRAVREEGIQRGLIFG